MTGRQALNILESDELKIFKEKHGDDILILVDGRVGIIEFKDDDGNKNQEIYIKELMSSGATGAVVGGGFAMDESSSSFMSTFL